MKTDRPETEKLIANLSQQIAAKGLDPLCAEQLDLLRSGNFGRIGMLEDLRDRCGLDIPDFQVQFPDFGTLPPEVSDLLANGILHDISWHDDTCPSFIRTKDKPKADELGNDRVWSLWVDFADPEDREFPEWPRFRVCAPAFDGDAFCTDNAADALAYLLHQRIA